VFPFGVLVDENLELWNEDLACIQVATVAIPSQSREDVTKRLGLHKAKGKEK
jgi:hypothetical protein